MLPCWNLFDYVNVFLSLKDYRKGMVINFHSTQSEGVNLQFFKVQMYVNKK